VDDAEFERLYGPWDPCDPTGARQFLVKNAGDGAMAVFSDAARAVRRLDSAPSMEVQLPRQG
jgi:class 3 adenylate cyclase